MNSLIKIEYIFIEQITTKQYYVLHHQYRGQHRMR
jgi:hypothetical protein